MRRIAFRLAMPSRGSWNGRWSGEAKNYCRVHTVTDKVAADLLQGSGERSWYYRWDDGWAACVTARAMLPRERHPKSDGFCGYDWMITNILRYGDTREPEPTS